MKRLSPTTVIALLALFFSLVGTGFAVNHYIITSTRQIKPTVLKQLKKPGPRGLTGVTGAQGPIGIAGINGSGGPAGSQGPAGSEGDQGSAGAQGVAGAQGLQGVKGDTGATGSKGDTGATGPKGDTGAISSTLEGHRVSAWFNTKVGDLLQSEETCPEGKLTGGGVRVLWTGTGIEAQVGNVSSFPIGHDTWRVTAIVTSPGDIEVAPFVICVR